MPEIVLKPGREKSILRHHPWIFSGAISKVTGTPETGQPVDVLSSQGEFLAKAAYNSNSNITGRIYAADSDNPVRRITGIMPMIAGLFLITARYMTNAAITKVNM